MYSDPAGGDMMHAQLNAVSTVQYIRLYSQGLLYELALVPGWMLILDHRAANNVGDELFCFGGLYFSPRILREFSPFMPKVHARSQ